MVVDILKDDHELLLTKCDLVDWGRDDLFFIRDMIDTLKDSGGCGLAANQIGILKRVIVIKNVNHFRVMINPIIVGASVESVEIEEGCLSYLNTKVKKKRDKWIRVEYYCPKLGRVRRKKFNGVQSIIVQHEIDHIAGKGFLNENKD